MIVVARNVRRLAAATLATASAQILVVDIGNVERELGAK